MFSNIVLKYLFPPTLQALDIQLDDVLAAESGYNVLICQLLRRSRREELSERVCAGLQSHIVRRMTGRSYLAGSLEELTQALCPTPFT